MSIATTWGTTPEERTRAFPCDSVSPIRFEAYYRGISVRAAPDLIFRWLCQLRIAPYSYDLIDNRGKRSPSELTPGLDDLAAGQTVMQLFEIVSFERPVHLTVTTRRKGGLFGGIAVSYMIIPGQASCRLLAKLCSARRGGVAAALVRLLLPWGDLVMMRKQLRTLRDLAERDERRTG